jgi:hypothetical protein
LFTLHLLWPFLWIWAMLYREDRGWGFGHHSQQTLPARVAELEQQLETLQGELAMLTGVNNPTPDNQRGDQ